LNRKGARSGRRAHDGVAGLSLASRLGANLRHHRGAAGLTQGRLAERVGLSSDMISRLQRGTAAPSFLTIELLARVLDILPEALFNRFDAMQLPGERGRLMDQLQSKTARLDNDDLAWLLKLIEAMR